VTLCGPRKARGGKAGKTPGGTRGGLSGGGKKKKRLNVKDNGPVRGILREVFDRGQKGNKVMEPHQLSKKRKKRRKKNGPDLSKREYTIVKKLEEALEVE